MQLHNHSTSFLECISARRFGALKEHPPHTTQRTKQKLAYKLHAAHKKMRLSRNDRISGQKDCFLWEHMSTSILVYCMLVLCVV